MGEHLTESERMARLEARFDNMEALMLRMDQKLDAWNENFVPRRELDVKFKAIEEDISAIKQRQQNTWNNLPFWISSLCAVIAIVVAIWPKVKG